MGYASLEWEISFIFPDNITTPTGPGSTLF